MEVVSENNQKNPKEYVEEETKGGKNHHTDHMGREGCKDTRHTEKHMGYT
jgi:hypothetical protein